MESGMLDRQIYRFRIRLQRLAIEKGLSSPEVLAASQRLDKLIVRAQRLQQELHMEKYRCECG